jgi:hypothetical protein
MERKTWVPQDVLPPPGEEMSDIDEIDVSFLDEEWDQGTTHKRLLKFAWQSFRKHPSWSIRALQKEEIGESGYEFEIRQCGDEDYVLKMQWDRVEERFEQSVLHDMAWRIKDDGNEFYTFVLDQTTLWDWATTMLDLSEEEVKETIGEAEQDALSKGVESNQRVWRIRAL